jgi:tryptophan-rich sensory protein
MVRKVSKPFFTPPNWVFGPVWTLLFILMGVSLFLVLEEGIKRKDVRQAAIIFCCQFVLMCFGLSFSSAGCRRYSIFGDNPAVGNDNSDDCRFL